jgi:hypothetical protein
MTIPNRLVLLFVLLAAANTALAQGPVALPASAPAPAYAPAPCQNGPAHRCQLVPATKQIKKTVYEVQEVPYCVKKLPPLFGFHKHGCDDCPECDCVRYKKVLVKREIVCDEVCTTKCVPMPCGPCSPGANLPPARP